MKRNHGEYNLKLIKVDKDNTNTKLAGAVFKIEQLDESDAVIHTWDNQTTNASGEIVLPDITVTEEETHRFRITEITPPPNYLKIIDPFEITVDIILVNGEYIATASLVEAPVTGVTLGTLAGNVIALTIENEYNAGVYSFALLKLKQGSLNPLAGVKFKIEVYEGETPVLGEIPIEVYNNMTTDANGKISIPDIEINDEGIYRYVITELSAPKGYAKINAPIVVTVEITRENGKYVAYASLSEQSAAKDVSVANNVVTVSIENGIFDLALRKYITKVNGVDLNDLRIPNIDPTKINDATPEHTADYKHRKDPVEVTTGDIVTYEIAVYNEGDVDGEVIEIVDILPIGLEYVSITDPDSEYEVSFNAATRELKISRVPYLFYLPAYSGTGDLPSEKIELQCEVTAKVGENDKVLTNVATMHYTAVNDTDDLDSEPETFTKPSQEELPEYKGNAGNKEDLSDPDYHYKGQQDDDDFEKVVIKGKKFDLALRKFISDVVRNGEPVNIGDREPVVDVSKMGVIVGGKEVTTFDYIHPKTPVQVRKGDHVIYTIRVYNEGDLAGYASRVTDYLPPYLEFVVPTSTTTNDINSIYEWEVVPGTNGREITTEYLKKDGTFDSDSQTRPALLKAYDAAKPVSSVEPRNPDYIDLQIECIVKDTAPLNQVQTNIAAITEHTDEDGEDIKDRDSEPEKPEIPEDSDLPDYKKDDDRPYVPGQEDDDDFEKVIVGDFDLALRKFITEIERLDGTKIAPNPSRVPELTINEEKYKNGDTNFFDYNHPKNPLLVRYNDVVIYTIRIYNEGNISGYAAEIKDDIPDGLLYLPDHNINKAGTGYGWKMYDEDGNETDKVEEAVALRTDYLSKEKEKTAGENLLQPYDPTQPISDDNPRNPDYRDVKVAFKVNYQVTRDEKGNIIDADRIITNHAQISKHTDKDGNDIDDVDSTPDEWIDDEDDQDVEHIKVQYFDLGLRKWVTEAIVAINGKETIYKTGNTAEDTLKKPAAVNLGKNEIDKVKVQFKYSIRVNNHGEIEGYAKEVKDHIPNGLKFDPNNRLNKDNGWVWDDEANNIVKTDKLKDTLLKPGEYKDIEIILDWIPGEHQEQVNYAEISKDDNPSKTPDIDSTPDNWKPKRPLEDDEDFARVIVIIKQGGAVVYTTLIMMILTIAAGGIFLIKKYVI